MNKTLDEAMAFAEGLALSDTSRDPRIQRFVIPPFTAVREVKRRLADTSVKVGAQNMHWDDAGAWTGEISAPMLTDCGLDLVELGHSERREHFGETDDTVGRKTATAVRNGLTPLICIGETLSERESGQADAVLKRQVEGALAGLAGTDREKPVLLAYEPVWAIGVNGIPASADYADDRHAQIAEVAKACLGVTVPVLYGGSVNPGNCAELIAKPHIDGLFIGRSAWDVAGYLDILTRVSSVL
jgi:triosephosphate isomerase